MSTDDEQDTKELEIVIEYPGVDGNERITRNVPADMNRGEAKALAQAEFFNRCDYGYNAHDFPPADDDEGGS